MIYHFITTFTSEKDTEGAEIAEQKQLMKTKPQNFVNVKLS